MLTVRDAKPMQAKTKVIFFIADCAPTPKELAECESLERPKRHLVYRNAAQVARTDSLEKCDAVAGCVPESYSHLPIATKDGEYKSELTPLASNQNDKEEQQAIQTLSEYSIAAVLALVTKKDSGLTIPKALELERKGKNRSSLISELQKLP